MIRNLRETTQKNTEQDWLKTNLAKFTRLLQGQRDLLTVARLILSEMAPLVEMQHGVFYITDTSSRTIRCSSLLASYAYRKRKSVANEFQLGESLVGQCALEKERIIVKNVPGRLREDKLRSRRSDADKYRRAAGAVRRAGQGRDRARLVQTVQRNSASASSTSLPNRSVSSSTRSKRT